MRPSELTSLSIATQYHYWEPGSTPHAIDAPINTANANVLGVLCYHCAVQAYWQGYSERCEHYIGKCLKISSSPGRFQFITFLQGIKTNKLKARVRNASLVLKAAASLSDCNFINKVRFNQSLFDAVVFLFTLLTHEIF